MKRFFSAPERERVQCCSEVKEAALLLVAESGSHFQLPQQEEIDTMAAFRWGVLAAAKASRDCFKLPSGQCDKCVINKVHSSLNRTSF